MATLFDKDAQEARRSVAPLAVRMRPKNLNEFLGQADAVGEGTWLRRAIEADALHSVILYGPPGTGKTTLARIIAGETKSAFVEVSAITGGVKDLREAIQSAENRLTMSGEKTILFVDEIHRFNRSQQDSLLHAVEDRVIVLIGATTENPFFEVNSALNSRSRVIELLSLSDGDIEDLIQHALKDPRGYDGAFAIDDDALAAIVLTAGGDARVALTTLELAVAFLLQSSSEDPAQAQRSEQPLGTEKDQAKEAAKKKTRKKRPKITLEDIRQASPTRTLPYDKDGDTHYDVISAFIKSMRGSDPDATMYWLARMIVGGEDPKFIARRILIAASEDIGNADPNALLVAHAAFKATESIGYPECRINLAQAALYNALAPKSNASYEAIDRAMNEVRNGPARSVPNHLRDRHRPGAEEYENYLYPHSYPEGRVEQQYLPDGLEEGAFFDPTSRGWEALRVEILGRGRESF